METQAKKRKKEWFDDDRFWRETYPFLFTEKRFAGTADEIRKALRLAKPRGRSALDLGCGPGRCAIALSERGFAVTGVDRTRYYLDKARARARAAGVQVEWVRQDIRDFRRASAYDLALSMFTSLGYFESRDEDRRILENVFASLKPGGVFLIETAAREPLARIFQPAGAQKLADGAILVDMREILDDWSRIHSEWIIIRGRRVARFKLKLNLYAGRELGEMLERAGFIDVTLYGSLEGEPYGVDARRLIAVGRKPKPTQRVRRG